MDANGILNVTALEKSTGKENKITITNDAEKYKKEDEELRQKVESRNHLENYAYQIKGTVDDEKLKDKLDESDREQLKESSESCIKWMDDNQEATKEEYDEKMKEIE